MPQPDFAPQFSRSLELALCDFSVFPYGAFAEVALPFRQKDVVILQKLLQAVKQKASLDVTYCSLHSGTERRRRLAPHAFATDGLRWHVRAWCCDHCDYGDFLPSRMSDARDFRPHQETGPDVSWKKLVELRFAPAPKLGKIARKAVEIDYCMEEGVLSVSGTRETMAGYV